METAFPSSALIATVRCNYQKSKSLDSPSKPKRYRLEDGVLLANYCAASKAKRENPGCENPV